MAQGKGHNIMSRSLSPILQIRLGMMRAMNHLMPNCEEASLLVSRSLDEKLPLAQRIRLRSHLLFCEWCRRFEGQLNLMRGLIRATAPPEETLPHEGRERIKRSLEEEGS